MHKTPSHISVWHSISGATYNSAISFSVFILGSDSPQLHGRKYGTNKESVELTFVYLLEGCGKTHAKINDTIPHTVVDMEHQGAGCTFPHDSTRSECCSVSSFSIENYHIF